MDSSKRYLKSLKNTLLEFVVLFSDLTLKFLEEKSDISKIASAPMFPRHLFDEIIETSKDLCWQIKSHGLIQYVNARDKLKWNGMSFNFISRISLDHKTKSLFYTKPTLKTLKASIDSPTTDVMDAFEQVSNLADTLENLDLRIRKCPGFFPSKGIIGHLRLKRLKLNKREFFINIAFDNFPFSLDSDKLTVFDLRGYPVTKILLETLIGFKNLVHLSLWRMVLSKIALDELISAVVTLKGLRILNLYLYQWEFNEKYINEIVKNLENLDILELRYDEKEICKQLDIPTKRKLKVLNCWIRGGFYSHLSQFYVLAHRVGDLGSIEGIMTVLSTTMTKEFYDLALARLNLLISEECVSLERLIEAEKMGIFNFRPRERLTIISNSRPYCRTSYSLPMRIACQLFFRYKSYLLQTEWLHHYMKPYKGTTLEEKFLYFHDFRQYH